MIEPNDKFVDDLYHKNAAQIFIEFFPEDSPFRIWPKNIDNTTWKNHMWALVGMICNLKHVASCFLKGPPMLCYLLLKDTL